MVGFLKYLIDEELRNRIFYGKLIDIGQLDFLKFWTNPSNQCIINAANQARYDFLEQLTKLATNETTN